MKGITRSGKAGSSLQILKNLDYQTREFDIYLIGDGEPWRILSRRVMHSDL